MKKHCLRSWRLLAAAACLGAAALPLVSQSPSSQTFTESTDVVVVEVPVQVIRDGEPVRGLTAADFEIYEGRKKQPITGFEILDLTTVEEPAPGKPAAAPQRVPFTARRRFLLLFDMSFANAASHTKAREAAQRLLKSGLHPTDLAAVATYRASKGPQLILGFTSDRRQIEAALDQLGYVERAADPLQLVFAGDGGGGGGGGGGRTGGASGRRAEGDSASSGIGAAGNEWVDSLVASAEQAANESQQNSVTAFSRAIGEFAQRIGSVKGRKHVIFLSEGFDSQLMLGTQDDAEIQQMNEDAASGAIWKVNPDVRYGNTRISREVERMLEELRRADCVIQAVDIGGLRAYGAEEGVGKTPGQESLFMMADSTGGELIRNFNDLSTAMEQVLKRTSVTYVLSYQPEGLKHDGDYHKLRVELKNASRGTRVVYRPGYYAPKPFAQRSRLEKVLETAGQVVSGQEGGTIDASVLAAPFAAPGKAYVPVLVEVDGKSLLAGQTGQTSKGGTLPVEIYVYAMTPDGAVQDFFAKTIGLDLAKVEKALRGSGIKLYGDLRLPTGSYSLRILVRNGQTGASGLRVASLEVPAFSADRPVLLQPFFPEPTNRWLLVRETAEAPKDVPYPFMLQEQPYIPAALPVLQPRQEARMSLVGYHLKPGRLQADSLVLTADGKEIGPGEVRLLGRQGDAAGPDRLEASFRPPALQPGEYLLLVTLTDPAGGVETSTTSFVVASAAPGTGR
ncbi:MAG TPA: VWA domain-containing protein [Thermoanaerobaculia bacterium]